MANHWLLGVALSVGTTKQSFSTVGGFTQDAFSASLYGAFRNEPWWANVVAAAGTQRYSVNRLVQLGITLQPNVGTTTGTNVSLALETGYDFIAGRFTHGPVVGITLQRVRVDGFTESGSFTSLGFDDQTRNSAISELGYQASFDAGAFRPFAKAVWNHELARPTGWSPPISRPSPRPDIRCRRSSWARTGARPPRVRPSSYRAT